MKLSEQIKNARIQACHLTITAADLYRFAIKNTWNNEGVIADAINKRADEYMEEYALLKEEIAFLEWVQIMEEAYTDGYYVE